MERQTGKQQPTTTGPESKDKSNHQIKGAFKLQDQRPEAAVQRKLGQIMNASARVQKAAQMQALANEYTARELPRLQQIEVPSKSTSTGLVAQRSPKEWRHNDHIDKVLAYEYGYMSTWKKVQQTIRKYMPLDRIPVAIRIPMLNKLSTLLDTWEAKPIPTKAKKRARAERIRADLAALRALIATEYEQIEDDRILEDIRDRKIAHSIPAELTEGLNDPEMNKQAKAARLFDNICNFRFRYTGSYNSSQAGFHAHQGDCSTLVNMFIEVANAHDIDANATGRSGAHLVDPGPILGRATTGNTHDRDFWFFYDHSWVEVDGTAYDLLFKVSPPPTPIHKVDEGTYKGVSYLIFANGRYLITPGAGKKLAFAIKGMGIVHSDEQATKDFIDLHHKK